VGGRQKLADECIHARHPKVMRSVHVELGCTYSVVLSRVCCTYPILLYWFIGSLVCAWYRRLLGHLQRRPSNRPHISGLRGPDHRIYSKQACIGPPSGPDHVFPANRNKAWGFLRESGHPHDKPKAARYPTLRPDGGRPLTLAVNWWKASMLKVG
jgi:hypothetical protein